MMRIIRHKNETIADRKHCGLPTLTEGPFCDADRIPTQSDTDTAQTAGVLSWGAAPAVAHH